MITGSTKIVALIGDPVEHSLSPVIHNAIFRDQGLDFVYVALRVREKSLPEAIAGARALGIRGINVTVPHKIAVLPLVDRLDKSASLVGAVNTIKNDGGKLVGFNTDGAGAVKALEREIGTLRGKRVLLLGSGGAGRAIAFSLVDARIKVTLANRTADKTKKLAAEIKRKTGTGVEHVPLVKKDLKKTLEETDILINSTSVGMNPKPNQTPVTADMMHSALVVNDIVYKPLQTRLLDEAKRAGAQTVNGLEMLIHQAAASAEIWLGKKVPIELMRVAAKLEMDKKGIEE